MEIFRGIDHSSIKKELIDIDSLNKYDKSIENELSYLIVDVIENYSISSLDLITLLRKKYNGSLTETIKKIDFANYNKVRLNCYYQSKILKEKLEKCGVNTYYLTHQAKKFALNAGDEKMKEAHVSLVYPTIRDGRLYYIIFDPGLKVYKPIGFYDKNSIVSERNNDLIMGIEYDDNNIIYPYSIYINGLNPYSYTSYPHNVIQRFNPIFKTINIDEMMYPIVYNLFLEYKSIKFSKDKLKRAYINLKHIDKKLEFADFSRDRIYTYTYDELLKKNDNNLKNELRDICYKLNLNINDVIENIKFMIEVHDDFLNYVMDKDVLEEYKKRKKLIK